MSTLRENISYKDYVVCPACKSQVEYKVVDIKGVEEKFILCPVCRKKVNVP